MPLLQNKQEITFGTIYGYSNDMITLSTMLVVNVDLGQNASGVQRSSISYHYHNIYIS